MKNKFVYKKIKYRFISFWNKKWNKGFFIKKNKINLSEGSTCINYSQQCFEGIKCFLYKKKKKIFRIEKNSFRFQKSCKKIFIPIFSILNFINSITILIYLNNNYIPNYKLGYLYLRPLMLGIGNNIGVKTSYFFIFIIYCLPVLYSKNNFNFLISNFNKRVISYAGNYKFGSNYILNINNNYLIKKEGFKDCIYLNNLSFEEIGTANIIYFYKKKVFYSNNSSILPGINNFFLNCFLKKINFNVNNKKINFKNINNFEKIFYCGTAAQVKEVKCILYKNKIICYSKNLFFILLKKIIKIINNNIINIKSTFLNFFYQ